MAKYKLTNLDLNIIIRTSDWAAIPIDESNLDYQDYLSWLAEDPENEPDPSD